MEISLEVAQAEKKEEQVKKPVASLDKLGRAYATGKRKTSIARVWLKPGKGKITVNKQDFDKYFTIESAKAIANLPFAATETEGKYDVYCTVVGGGTTGQVEAIKHGISRALVIFNEVAYRPILRTAGFLTRDSRVVERKKYGRKKARKSFQFSKR